VPTTFVVPPHLAVCRWPASSFPWLCCCRSSRGCAGSPRAAWAVCRTSGCPWVRTRRCVAKVDPSLLVYIPSNLLLLLACMSLCPTLSHRVPSQLLPAQSWPLQWLSRVPLPQSSLSERSHAASSRASPGLCSWSSRSSLCHCGAGHCVPLRLGLADPHGCDGGHRGGCHPGHPHQRRGASGDCTQGMPLQHHTLQPCTALLLNLAQRSTCFCTFQDQLLVPPVVCS